ncbi:MAG TPA: glycosyltransferase family 61 protein [Flavitalea sp.]|nr:glycosyltransferase family 61 protein [Flavitalea sp.]
MKWRGRGYKSEIIKTGIGFVKNVFPPGILYNAPRTAIPVTKWLQQSADKGFITSVFESEYRKETLPEIVNHPLTSRFVRYAARTVPPAFVANISEGCVYGKYTEAIVPAPGLLAADLSRQFGAYGGVPASENALIQTTLKLPKPKRLKGKVAVISTSGADNFHHWLYDCLPRIYLLKKSGMLDSIDHFLIAGRETPFRMESIQRMAIDTRKIINPHDDGNLHYQAQTLVVPSLPSELGTVSPWVVNFLNELFNASNEKNTQFPRIYISRRNAGSRKITNNDEFLSLLHEFNIIEIFPEDYPVAEFAKIVAGARFIISIHGSGLSNLCFASVRSVVVDILAPYHQDSYYWLISNIRGARYIGFFSEGTHPSDEEDLVKKKRDDDLLIDINEMRMLLSRELKTKKNTV